jgi:stalled ribosome alternative rescue factor ArfA
MKKSIVSKDLRTPKYKMRVFKSKKGKGSFKRTKRVVID